MTNAYPAAQTAYGPMFLAAVEQMETPGRRLCHDDLASSFLPPGLRAMVAATRWRPLRCGLIRLVETSGPGLWANLACRKQFIDDKLDNALPDIDAVVILGAGLDTRACRLARRSTIPMFEVDVPVNIARKQQVLRRALGTPPPSIHLVAADFERDDLSNELARHGYRSDYRTFFVWEGVTQYLTDDAMRRTLKYLQAAAPGSQLVFTHVRRDFVDGTELHGAGSLYRRFRERRPLWKFGIQPGDVPAFLAEYGWRVIQQAGPEYFLDHYVTPAGRRVRASQLEWSAYAAR